MIDDGLGEIIARVLYAIFRNRPNLAYTIFALVVLAFIGAMYFNAQTPDEHVLPVILFVFVVSVVLGHTIRDLRRMSTRDFQAHEETSVEDETPEDREAMVSLENLPEEKASLDRGTPPPPTPDQPVKKPVLKQIQSFYPGLRTGDFLQVLIISVVFLSLGYLVAYFFGTKMLLAATAQIMGAEAAMFTASIIEETFFQLACGLPCAIFSIAPVVAVLLLLVSRSPDSYQAILKLTAAILSFLFGLVIFVPVQMFLILAAVI